MVQSIAVIESNSACRELVSKVPIAGSDEAPDRSIQRTATIGDGDPTVVPIQLRAQ